MLKQNKSKHFPKQKTINSKNYVNCMVLMHIKKIILNVIKSPIYKDILLILKNIYKLLK